MTDEEFRAIASICASVPPPPGYKVGHQYVATMHVTPDPKGPVVRQKMRVRAITYDGSPVTEPIGLPELIERATDLPGAIEAVARLIEEGS